MRMFSLAFVVGIVLASVIQGTDFFDLHKSLVDIVDTDYLADRRDLDNGSHFQWQ